MSLLAPPIEGVAIVPEGHGVPTPITEFAFNALLKDPKPGIYSWTRNDGYNSTVIVPSKLNFTTVRSAYGTSTRVHGVVRAVLLSNGGRPYWWHVWCRCGQTLGTAGVVHNPKHSEAQHCPRCFGPICEDQHG